MLIVTASDRRPMPGHSEWDVITRIRDHHHIVLVT